VTEKINKEEAITLFVSEQSNGSPVNSKIISNQSDRFINSLVNTPLSCKIISVSVPRITKSVFGSVVAVAF